MAAEPTPIETLFLLDDPDLFQEIVHLLASPSASLETGCPISVIASGGTGFAKSRRFQANGTIFNFLLINNENAHPFAYLTIGQRTIKREIPVIVSVSQAQSLQTDLYPGDIAIVTEAAALPYPALYKNATPEAAGNQAKGRKNGAEHYRAGSNIISSVLNLLTTCTLPKIWQTSIPAVRTGYAKHPAWRGSLQPWAAEQLASLKDAGLATISQMPAGVYEAQYSFPTQTVICFNMITRCAEDPSRRAWNRNKKTLLYPALRLLLDLMMSNSKLSRHGADE